MADVNTKIRLSAEDAASPKINQLKQSLSGLASSGGLAGGLIGGLAAGGVMGLANAAIQAVPAMAGAAWEMSNMAAQSQRTEASFSSLAAGVGQSSQAMLAAMRTATAGTVADTDLMLAANRAMMLGVSDNAEEMSQLMAAAIERGRALGVSSQQAVNDIITGIGRMSPMILDNLGIVGAQQSMEEYARSLGVTADALTDVQKKQALVNAVLASASGGPVLEDAASAFERMDASIKGLQEALGKLFGPAIAAIARQLADAVEGVTDSLNPEGIASTRAAWADVNVELDGVRERIQTLQNLMRDMEGVDPAWLPPDKQQYSTDDIKAQIAALREQEAALVASAGAARLASIEAQGLKDITVQTEAEFLAATWSSFGFSAALGTVGSEAAAAASQVELFNAALANVAPVLSSVTNIRQAAIGRVESLGLQAIQQGADPSEVTAMVANATDAIWNMGLSYDATTEAQFANKLAVEAQIDPLQNLNDKLREADKASSQLAKNGLAEAERAFDSLRGRVQSMLQQSLTPEGISLPEGLLPRTDDINENARRLAAIANEGIGDQSWMEEFKNEVPGIFEEIVSSANPQAAAARIFQEFQAGLRPELIDKDLVKERIKAAITGENNMAALAQEIAAELAAEMNISLPEALKATQGAMGLPSKGGDPFGAGFEEGVDGAQVAASSLAKIAKAFLDSESQVKSSGAVVGAWWGMGFMTTVGDNVPPGLLDMLTVKLLPSILASIAQRNSTTGPSDGN